MSSSIRPPGATPPAPTTIGEAGQVGAGPAEVRQSDPARPSATSANEVSPSPTADWLRRLEAGEVTKDQAIDGLVARAVEAHGGARLSAAQRTELADVLRQTLLNDPVLSALLGD